MTGRRTRLPDRALRRSAKRKIGLIAAAEPIGNPDPTEAVAVAAVAAVPGLGAEKGAAPSQISADTLLAFAREIYTLRHRRSRYLPADLFGEPTWDILLDLYVATRENRPVPTTSACIGAHVPPTTALRWLRTLEEQGLLERQEDARDGRRTFVRLTEQGLAAMEDCLRTTLATFDQTIGVILRHASPLNGQLAEAAE